MFKTYQTAYAAPDAESHEDIRVADVENESDNRHNGTLETKKMSWMMTVGIVAVASVLAIAAVASTWGAPKESNNRSSFVESISNVAVVGGDGEVHDLSKTFAPSPVTYIGALTSTETHTRNPTPSAFQTRPPVEEKTFNPTPAGFSKTITLSPTPEKYDEISLNPTPLELIHRSLSPTPADLLVKDVNGGIVDFDTVDSKPGENKEDASSRTYRKLSSSSRKSAESEAASPADKGKAPTTTAVDSSLLTRNPTPSSLQTRNPTPLAMETRNPTPVFKTKSPSVDEKTLSPTEEWGKSLNPTPGGILTNTLNPTPTQLLTLNPTPADYHRTDQVVVVDNVDNDQDVTSHKPPGEDETDSEEVSSKRSSVRRSESAKDNSLKATSTATGTVLKKQEEQDEDEDEEGDSDSIEVSKKRSSVRGTGSATDGSLKATTSATGTELKKQEEESEDKTVHSSKKSN